MTRPRSFGARPTKQEQLGRVRGIGEAANALDAPTNPDAGDMRLLPMDEVRVDPNNPRRLNLTWELLQAPFEDLEPASVRNEVETIHGLAQTFRQVGQRSPIEVVRDGTLKRIVFGERRYWAARVAGLAYIKAIVLRRAPENIALVQLIENIQHKQMPLYETVLNLRSVIERESELDSPVLDATDLMDRTGLTRATAYRYWKYMDLPEDVETLLANGTLSTHEELGSILKHATAAEREAALARYLGGGSLGARLSEDDTRRTPRRRGRPKTTISFGSTKNPQVARHLFQTLAPDSDYEAFDWNDVAEVSKAWQELLAGLETRLRTE